MENRSSCLSTVQKISIAALALLLSACGGGTADGPLPLPPQYLSSSTSISTAATIAGPRASYSVKKTASGYTVTSTTGVTQSFGNITQLTFSDFTVNLQISEKAGTVSEAELQSLVELYIAYFNRIPDADGIAYWIDQRKAGKTFSQISQSFYDIAIQFSTQTGYSASMSNTDFIKVIYKNVLGRDTVDQGGLDHWNGQLTSGAADRGTLISTILAAAHTFKGDVTYGWVADLLDNKVLVGKAFSVGLGLGYIDPNTAITNGKAIAAAVTSSDTSSAVKLIGVPLSEGNTGGAWRLLGMSNGSANFLTHANAQGNEGYRFKGGYAFSDGMFEMYAKDVSTRGTLNYKLLPAATTLAAMITQANAQGKDGYQYEGNYSFGDGIFSIYLRDSGNSDTFTYLSTPSSTTSKAFLTQANEQGDKNYAYLTDYYIDGQSVSLFAKSRSAKYVHRALAFVNTQPAFVTQANAQGKEGYRFRSAYAFSDGFFMMYVNDSSAAQSAAVSLPLMPQSSSEFLNQANLQAMSGYQFQSAYAFGATIYAIYSK